MRLSAFLLLAFASACAIFGPKDTDFRQVALEELNRREALWKGAAIHSYDLSYQRDCACAATATQPAVIHVRNDVITRVVAADGSDIAPVTGTPWPSVDSMFVWSRQLVSDKAFAVEIGFDTGFNFPNHILAQNSNGAAVTHNTSTLTVQTATAPIVVSYRIEIPVSKSKSVTWRNR